MLEQQIYSIESANINQETLAAMKNAGAAMKTIHGKMTMEDVDVTMYVVNIFFNHPSKRRRKDIHVDPTRHDWTISLMDRREQLREQHELTQEIGNAITSMPITEPIDEDELEADLAALEQEKLDEKMLNTGTVPVSDSLTRMPAAADGPRKFILLFYPPEIPTSGEHRLGTDLCWKRAC